MRVQEIIRSILDMLDQAEQQPPESAPDEQVPNEQFYNNDVRRFRQIVDLADSGEPTEYSNTPREEYADLSAVTTAAGGGMQTPKHPADIRGELPSIYPGKVYGAR
jgi:hypothetical protein